MSAHVQALYRCSQCKKVHVWGFAKVGDAPATQTLRCPLCMAEDVEHTLVSAREVVRQEEAGEP